MRRKRFYFGEAFDENAQKVVLVRTDSEGRNLSQNPNIPQMLCDRWFSVWTENAKQARAEILAGRGVKFS